VYQRFMIQVLRVLLSCNDNQREFYVKVQWCVDRVIVDKDVNKDSEEVQLHALECEISYEKM